MEVVQRAFNIFSSNNFLPGLYWSEKNVFSPSANLLYCFLNRTIPLLPGTREMYRTKGSFLGSVGFRGYEGGFDASTVKEERDFASMTVAMPDRS
jgi:hypothetical protein